MKLPVPHEALYAHSNWVEERMMQQDCPPRGTAEYIRKLAAMSEILEQMPPVVCLIGSTRFFQDFADYNLKFTLGGEIVLSIGCDTKKDGDLNYDEATKEGLDLLHMWKLILCDRVFCLNRDGYVGKSTARELGFSTLLGKPITYLEPPIGSVFMNYDIPEEMTVVLALAAAAGFRQAAKR